MNDNPPPRTNWRQELRLYAGFTYLALADWWWLPFGTGIGIAWWAWDTGHPPTDATALVHVAICLPAAFIGHRAGRWAYRAHARRDITALCPHPDHRIRHIHGGERRHGYLAQCMECGYFYRDWPGGDHGATRCWPG